MKIVTSALIFIIACCYITINGCQDKPLVIFDKIENYKPLVNDTMCVLIIDSIKGESSLNPNDTICLKCMPVDTPIVDKCLGIFNRRYLSPAEGTIFAIRKIQE